MLGQPVHFLTPDVVGVNMIGALKPGVTGTDLVLHVTDLLRRSKVVGKFVEFFGAGIRESDAAGSRHDIQHVAGVRSDHRLFSGR